MKKIIGLIPCRIGSKRLPGKALLPINNLPLIVHVYKRAKLSKKLNDVIVCCDDKKIFDVVNRYGGKAMITSKRHRNGTERISEAYNNIKKKYDLIADIQGDEPLINPIHIDQVVSYHLRNQDADIVVPTINIKQTQNENIIKIVKDKFKKVLYFSRSSIPFSFKRKNFFLQKHLSIISFKPIALKTYSKTNQTYLEKIEGIELLRALEAGLKIKSPDFKGDSFSVDVRKDYIKAQIKINKDKFYKMYKNY